MAADPTDIRAISSLGLRAWEGLIGTMPVTHRHDDLELNLLVAGECAYAIDGRSVRVPVGRLLILWGAVSHRVQVKDAGGEAGATRMIWATIPLRDVLAWPLDRRFLSRLLERGWAIDPVERETDPLMLRRWIDDLHEERPYHGPEAERIVRLEMQARLHRMVASRPRGASGVSRSAEPASAAGRVVARAERLIAERFREPLTVDDLAEVIDMHPNYAMQLFKKRTGQTFIQAITRRRVTYAQRRLALSSDPVLQIGLDAGFGSTSRFYEAFKHAVGSSPAAYRRSVCGASR